ncbi:MAG TPA: serine protease [Terriglobia bacterium]|nr:serine protease [Terriglobia bacterium]
MTNGWYAVLLLSAFPGALQAQSGQAPTSSGRASADVIEDAVVQIQVLIAGKPAQAIGTGFFAERDDLVVTAEHVYLAAESAINDSRDGLLAVVKQWPTASPGNMFFAPTELAAEDAPHDIAILRVNPFLVQAQSREFPIRPLHLAETDPRPGDDVAFAGYFGADTLPLFQRGVIAGRAKPSNTDEELVVQASTNSGQSGSPLVLVSSGKVVGVIVASLGSSYTPGAAASNTGLSRAAEVVHVRRLLNSIPPQGAEQRSVPGRSAVPRRNSQR